jgi:hypothetical protein
MTESNVKPRQIGNLTKRSVESSMSIQKLENPPHIKIENQEDTPFQTKMSPGPPILVRPL